MIAQSLSNGFVPPNYIKEKDIVWINARKEPFKIYGVFFDESEGRFLRMEKTVAKQFDTVFNNLNADTSGGRLRFVTDSPYIALYAKQENNLLLNNMSLCGHSGFDIYGGDNYLGTFLPKTNAKKGFSDIVKTGGSIEQYTVNFPLFDNVEELYIGVKKDSLILESEPYENEGKPVVFYGSSITQGACASRPGNCYTSTVCRKLRLDYINLGFAGRCFGEPEMAEYIAKLPMSAFVMDFDHNMTSAEELLKKHIPFYETVRKSHPDIPVIFVSAPDIAVKKDEFFARREVIKKTFNDALNRGENVYFADGERLYGISPFDCTVDGVHPNDLGFFGMAEEIFKVMNNALEGR